MLAEQRHQYILSELGRSGALSVAELVREGPEPAIELTLLTQYLERLPAETLGDVRQSWTKELAA